MTRLSDSDVLILGGGFAGVWCAKRLERALPADRTVTLVSSENYFVYQPLLPEVVGASLEPTQVVSPLRHLLRRTRVVRGEVSRVTPEERTVEVTGPAGETLSFSGRQLVIALGSVVDVSRIPGMAEHAFLMKNLADALRLRQAVIERLEEAVLETDADARARLLSFVVVGGGFSGVETAAEIFDLLRHAKKFYPALADDQLRVTCVHALPLLLPELHPDLGAYAQRLLERRGMDLKLERLVRAVSGEGVYLEDGELVPAGTVVCTVGNAPHPVLQDLDLPLERGRLTTDEFLRVPGREGLWAIGDCALIPDGRGGTSPPTAQYAVRQGDRAGRNVADALVGKEPKAFSHRSQGQLATLGHRNAVAWVGGFRFSGFFAWWLWRTVYLMKLPRFERKLQVVIEWTLRLFFPRSLNAVDVRPTHAVPHVHLEAGEVLFRQGDPSSAFYVVESGALELCQVDDGGQEVLCERLGPGDHFGEGSLLHKRARSTTARAVEPATVLALDARLFDELSERWQLLRRALASTSRRFSHGRHALSGEIPEEVLDRPCRDVMTGPAVTLPQDATLGRAARLFTERGFSAYPLVDGDGRLVGLATRADLYRALHGDADFGEPLVDHGTSEVRTVAPGDPVRRAAELMRRHGFQHVLVVDGDRRVEGILSFRDLMREALALQVGDDVPAPAVPN
ncbi:MAG: FAD-dependent oxidoreductase [Acidobacteriota bacterium]